MFLIYVEKANWWNQSQNSKEHSQNIKWTYTYEIIFIIFQEFLATFDPVTTGDLFDHVTDTCGHTCYDVFNFNIRGATQITRGTFNLKARESLIKVSLSSVCITTFFVLIKITSFLAAMQVVFSYASLYSLGVDLWLLRN